MDCALRLRERHAIKPEDIASVRCRTAEGPVPRLWEPLAAKHHPPNGYASKFSLPYLLAVILVKGRATLAEFTDDAVRDETVLRVAGKVATSWIRPSTIPASSSVTSQSRCATAARSRSSRIIRVADPTSP